MKELVIGKPYISILADSNRSVEIEIKSRRMITDNDFTTERTLGRLIIKNAEVGFYRNGDKLSYTGDKCIPIYNHIDMGSEYNASTADSMNILYCTLGVCLDALSEYTYDKGYRLSDKFLSSLINILIGQGYSYEIKSQLAAKLNK